MWLGFLCKRNALDFVQLYLQRGVQYLPPKHAEEQTFLTVHGFKMLCGLVKTDQANRSFHYYTDMEVKYNKFMRLKMAQQWPTLERGNEEKEEAALREELIRKEEELALRGEELALRGDELALRDEELTRMKEELTRKEEELARVREKTYDEVAKKEYVYILKQAASDSDRHKIGKSVDPKRRESQLNAASAQGYKVIYKRQTSNAKVAEDIAHHVLRRYQCGQVGQGVFNCRVQHSIDVLHVACSVVDTLASTYEYIDRSDLHERVRESVNRKAYSVFLPKAWRDRIFDLTDSNRDEFALHLRVKPTDSDFASTSWNLTVTIEEVSLCAGSWSEDSRARRERLAERLGVTCWIERPGVQQPYGPVTDDPMLDLLSSGELSGDVMLDESHELYMPLATPGWGWPEAEALRKFADASLVLQFEDGLAGASRIPEPPMEIRADAAAVAALPSGAQLCNRVLERLREVLIPVEDLKVSKPPDGYFGVVTKASKAARRGAPTQFQVSTEFARRHLPMLVAPLDAAASAASAGMAAAEPVLSLKGAAETSELKLLCFMAALAEAARPGADMGAAAAGVFCFVRRHIRWFNFSPLFVRDTTLRWWSHATIMAYAQSRVQDGGVDLSTPARVLSELAALLHYLKDDPAAASAECARELAALAVQALTDRDAQVCNHKKLRSRLVPLVEARLGKIKALSNLLAHAGKHPDRKEERLDQGAYVEAVVSMCGTDAAAKKKRRAANKAFGNAQKEARLLEDTIETRPQLQAWAEMLAQA
ncbi:hypothetical protein HYH03_011066 [Edaphochlamys debaryana]|uniref:Bacteriophage T5 Orf172 DNA-binding domain-containing protein n=1 Tax=Edaphochlamys debaryana TaxID=47281 RepID=A0A835Y0Q5_9CHLO|nr:hypothetical protein HYH03_011066 [Edaphochlamys debaryana]|eukprot:KAG2490430.1 hypothetical protein HYH03_011066 [Edaphochlamys debaryana]